MSDPDLSVFVEFGVGLAGFSGVVVAFSKSPGRLVDYDRFRVIQLLLAALIPAFLGLVPSILEAFGVAGGWIWWSQSALVAACILGTVAYAAHSVRSIAPEARATLSPTVWRVAIVGNLVFLAWNLLNLVGWPYPVSPGPAMAAMAWFLFVASLMFFRLLLVRFAGPGDAP